MNSLILSNKSFLCLIFILYKFNTVSTLNSSTLSNDTTKSLNYSERFVIITYPVLIIVGTICNIITFLVMRRKKLRNQSTGFYMAVLSIADELALLVGCVNSWLYTYKKVTILHLSTFTCKIFSVVLYTTMDFSVWMVVIMTIERFIAVTFPLRSIYFCTVKKAKLATLVLLCILFAMNSQFLITHSYVLRGNVTTKGCQSKSEDYDYFIQNLWPWFDAGKYSFVPFTTIIIFNVLIICNLIKASTSIKNLSSNHKLRINSNPSSRSPMSINQNHLAGSSSYLNNNNTSAPASSSNNRRLTMMLLVVSITFCILSTPLVLLQIIQNAITSDSKTYSTNNSTSSSQISFEPYYSISVLLQYSNHSINFFLYVISGKLFRREFIALLFDCMICFKRKIHKENSMYNDTYTTVGAYTGTIKGASISNKAKKNYVNKFIDSKQVKYNFETKNKDKCMKELDLKPKKDTIPDKSSFCTNEPLLSVHSTSANNELDNESTGTSETVDKNFIKNNDFSNGK